MPPLSYAIVSPARNEAADLPRLVEAIAAQTLRPLRWLIVDNGSTDATLEIAHAAGAADDAVRVIAVPGEKVPTRGGPVARAFMAGIDALDVQPDVVIKLDADISFEPDYFERLVAKFAAEPALGIAGGICLELEDGEWVPRHVTGGRVRGATRAYRAACLPDVLPLEDRPGWDGIDELKAIAHGWTTRSFGDLAFRHHRPIGRRDESRRRRLFAVGRAAYYSGYRPSYLILRSLYRARREAMALMMIAGYVSAAARREPRCEPAVLAHIRAEQRLRALPTRVREARGRRRPDAQAA
jgi:glycosyltransferase involved in cell wall biosynthesis